jgi:hypothetical protein
MEVEMEEEAGGESEMIVPDDAENVIDSIDEGQGPGHEDEDEGQIEPKVEVEDGVPPHEEEGEGAEELEEEPPEPLADAERIELLEGGLKTCKDRLDGFGQELKVILVEINIVCEWIRGRFGNVSNYTQLYLSTMLCMLLLGSKLEIRLTRGFYCFLLPGVELIDKASQLCKHIHDFDEIEELTKSLSMIKRGSGSRRSARQANAKWTKQQEKRLRRKKKYYDYEDDLDDDDELDYFDDDDDDDDDDDSINVRPKTEVRSEDDDFMFDPPGM